MSTQMPPANKRSRPWADLLPELVDAVISRLDIFSAARLAAGLAPWARTIIAAAAANNPFPLPFGKPCLLAPHEFLDGEDDQANDYTFDTLVSLRCAVAADGSVAPPAPALPPAVMETFRGRFWVGGKGTWLAAVDERCNAELVNLYTGARVRLPAASTIPGVEPCGYHCKVRHASWGSTYTYTFRKIALCGTPSPAAAAAYLAVAIVTSRILAVARGGDRSWMALKNHRDLLVGYDDAVVHRGKVFAVDATGDVFAWDLHAVGACPEPERLPAPPRSTRGGELSPSSVYQWNLAESADGRRLLLACTHGSYAKHEKPGLYRGTTKTVSQFTADGVHVHELDTDADGGCGSEGWRRVTGLGDRALFLGANWPLWAAVSRGPPEELVQPNRVYVAPAVLFGYPDKDFDIVVHDLGDGSCQQMKLSTEDRCDDFEIAPIWFTPTLQMWSRRESI